MVGPKIDRKNAQINTLYSQINNLNREIEEMRHEVKISESEIDMLTKKSKSDYKGIEGLADSIRWEDTKGKRSIETYDLYLFCFKD